MLIKVHTRLRGVGKGPGPGRAMLGKPIDPTDTYVVREMFACGEGHCLPRGFTHWESGEACPHAHSEEATNADCHLYWRKIAVPTETTSGDDMWAMLTSEPNRWSQLPLAPKGLALGTRFGPSSS